MKTLMVSEYDKVSMMFGPIFHARNEADAARAFNRKHKDDTDIDDFALCSVGVFDTDTGEIENINPPNQIPLNKKE